MTINSDTTPVDESPMFAPIPAWERGKKRRGFGRTSRPAEPRSFAPSAVDDIAEPAPVAAPMAAPVIDSEVPIADAGFATAPVYATRTRAKSSSAPMAIAAGIILIGGVAAAGWYYSQPHGQTGVAELTPGGIPTTTTTTTSGTTSGAASSDAAPPAQVAQNTPPPVAAKTTTTTTTRTAAARTTTATRAPTRSAAASDSAVDTTVNAPVAPAAQVPTVPVTSAPPMPLPTPGVAPPPSATALQPQAPLVLNPAPATTAPAAPQAVTPPPTEVPQA